MSYRVIVIMPDGERVGNGLRFQTHKEADAWGFDLLCRWFAPESYEVEESTDAPTHKVLVQPTRIEALHA